LLTPPIAKAFRPESIATDLEPNRRPDQPSPLVVGDLPGICANRWPDFSETPRQRNSHGACTLTARRATGSRDGRPRTSPRRGSGLAVFLGFARDVDLQARIKELTMVNRIAAWEAKDGTVHKTREEADRHDFEQFASSRLRKFQELHFATGERRWNADEIYQMLLKNAQALARCFPPRTSVLTEALAVPSVQRRPRDVNGHGTNGAAHDVDLDIGEHPH
jgi:hypothetical protein